VDVNEITVSGYLTVGGRLNAGILRGGAEGTIRLDASVNLYDPNNDGKVRINEIFSTIRSASNPLKGFLNVLSLKVQMCASAKIYVDWWNPFINWKCKLFICWPRGGWSNLLSFK